MKIYPYCKSCHGHLNIFHPRKIHKRLLLIFWFSSCMMELISLYQYKHFFLKNFHSTIYMKTKTTKLLHILNNQLKN